MGFRAATAIVLVVLLAGCAARTHVQYGAGSITGSGSSVNASSAAMNVQASGSTAAVLIGLGIAASVAQAQNDGVIYRVNPFRGFFESAPAPAPELAPVRNVNEQDCTRPIEDWSANLKCR
jgi:hypothetical protein